MNEGARAARDATQAYDEALTGATLASTVATVAAAREAGCMPMWERLEALFLCPIFISETGYAGNIINPMIVDGQIHGGLAMGLAPALLEEISYDDNGNISGGSFLDYLLPTAMETPKWETGKTVTPSPHHPQGAKGVGESATVGALPAIANAVVDALAHLGVRHVDIPITPEKVWGLLREKGAIV
jgi:molybdopterin-binding aldehyde dehydrogenase-like protein